MLNALWQKCKHVVLNNPLERHALRNTVMLFPAQSVLYLVLSRYFK